GACSLPAALLGPAGSVRVYRRPFVGAWPGRAPVTSGPRSARGRYRPRGLKRRRNPLIGCTEISFFSERPVVSALPLRPARANPRAPARPPPRQPPQHQPAPPPAPPPPPPPPPPPNPKKKAPPPILRVPLLSPAPRP